MCQTSLHTKFQLLIMSFTLDKDSLCFCTLKLIVLKPNSYKCQVWNYNSADWTGLNNALDNAYTIYENINDIVHYWTNLVTKVKSCYNPLRLGTVIVLVSSGKDFVNTPVLYSDRATG